MAVKSAPKITACKASDNWTCVTFTPDLAKFGMNELETEMLALMRKRVYDLAGIFGKSVKVGTTASFRGTDSVNGSCHTKTVA